MAQSVRCTREYATRTVIIPNNESLSGVVGLLGYALAGIVMPSSWTAADLTFRVANAYEGTYYDLYDDNGIEVVAKVAASHAIGVKRHKDTIAPFLYLKVRSGTAGTPVAQGGARTIVLVFKA
jgi:hypothetical protein